MKHLWVIAIGLCCLLAAESARAQTWVSLNGPKLMSNTREITLNNSGTPTLYIAEDGYSLKSTDGGASWRGTGADFTNPLAVVTKFNDALIVVGSRQNVFLRSQDGGNTWNTVTSSPNIQTDLVPLRLTTSQVNTNYMFLGRQYVNGNRSVWKSTNSGGEWSPSTGFIFPTNVHDISTYPVNDEVRKNTLFACGVHPTGSQQHGNPNTEAYENGVYWSQTNGTDWYAGPLGGYNVYSVAILDRGATESFYVYAAVKGGDYPGIYRSTNSGLDFGENPIFTAATVNIIRINNSSSPKAIFLGTDDNVWRSTNDGSSWSKVSSFGSDNNVTSLAVSGTGTVFAGTTGSLYKSTNNGSTWTEVGKMNVSAAEGEGAALWAVTKDNSFVGKSTNGGTSWSNSHIGSAGTAFSAEAIHRVSSTEDLFVGGALNEKAAIYRSTNAGGSFSQAYHNSSTFSSGSKILTLGSDILSYDGYVYAGGGISISSSWRNIFHSTDDGSSWAATNNAQIGTGNVSVVDQVVLSNSTRYAMLGTGQVLKTTNSWNNSSSVLDAAGTGHALAIPASSTSVVYAARSGGLWRSSNGGSSWSQKRSDNVKQVRVPSSSDHVFALASDSIFSSTNGGTNWTNISGSLPRPINNLIAPPNAGYIYAATTRGMYAMDIPPVKPQGVAVNVHSEGGYTFPKLTWTTTSEVDVNPGGAYRIERRSQILGGGGRWTSWSVIDIVGGDENEYIDYEFCPVGSGSMGVQYRVRAEDEGANLSEYSETVQIAWTGQSCILKAWDPYAGEVPVEFVLFQNHPNPFNPQTEIRYGLPEDAHVSLRVYDLLGREVATLVNELRPAGYHAALLDGSNLASGVYFARFTATDATGMVKHAAVSKLLLTK